ncbi:MAG: PAS domain-containing protein, partial [Thermodesulfobacteriota bacterium]
MPRKPAVVNTALLDRAFSRFSEAAETLSGTYELLARETAALRLDLEEKNRALSQALAEQESQHRFLTHILDNLEAGVVVLDPEGRGVLANQAAARLLGLSSGDPGEGFPAELMCLWRPREKPGPGDRRVVVGQGPGGRLLSCLVSPLPWPGEENGPPGLMVLLEDVTDQVSLGEQRERTRTLSAMGEMATQVA